MNKQINRIFIIFIILSFILSACANEPDQVDKDTKSNGEKTTEKDGGDLVIARASDAVTLDPAGSNDTISSDVQMNIFETLVQLDEKSELQPNLAVSWEAVEDTVWEFKLQEGITFHDGTPFNAAVVKANIERTIDPDIGSPRAMLYNMVTNIEVVDDVTVRFETKYPFSPLPAHLAHPGGVMISKEQIETDYEAMKNGEEPGNVINEQPIGTGPFIFDSWENGQSIRLVKNENYWGKDALLDSVTFKVVPEDLTRLAELETGDSHVSNPLNPSDITQVETNEELSVQKQESSALTYIGFNMKKKPFDDVKVRQALSMAIDKQQVIEGVYDGIGIPAKGPLAPTVFGYDEKLTGIPYNVEEANELLKEAGYEDGFSTTIWTNDSRDRIDIATNVQAQLQKIGVKAEIEVLEWGAMLEQTAKGEHDMFVFGWTTVTGDADNGLYPLFHTDNLGEAGNRTFVDDAKLDKLLDQARQTNDEKERFDYYREAQELITDIAPIIPIHHQEYLLGVRKEVQGLTQSPIQILNLKEAYME